MIENCIPFYMSALFFRYQISDLVKLDILLNGQPVDAMATIVHKLKAQRIGRELVDKLKKFIDRFNIFVIDSGYTLQLQLTCSFGADSFF